MGVGYGVRLGFGVEVTSDHEDFKDDAYSFLENLTYETRLSFFVTGSYYGCRNLKYYITSDNIKEALGRQEYDLRGHVEELLHWLKFTPELKVIGHPNIVGGLLIS